ncbi:hypothetical protein QQS21_008521 [Conoideocrella luteorostrata]|uniref:MACPF domain-containing protein n=1 Tax=Conoideocrella luteorostrata TaxID=1105319 RepID=A0AAJ0FYL6_9HYPO|nr:hypothetical protein QQS21_008521 [Conoideocrella luteorostrata]
MALEGYFPDDPTKPSLHYAVSTLMPLAIPWTNAPMQIGTSFLKSSQDLQLHFGQESAFSSEPLYSTPLIFTESCAGQVNEATVAGSSNSHRDLSADIAGSIGGSALGGSARGQYSKNSDKDESLNKASIHTSFRCGKVTLAHFPSLSRDAIRILRTSSDPSRAFSDKFGDYFVGGYILGGANSTLASGAGASERSSEHLSVSLEVHVLFTSYSDTVNKQSADYSSLGTATLTAFDSLDAYQTEVKASEYEAYRNATQASRDNRQRGAALQERVKARLNAVDLGSSGAQLPWERCAELCRSGLVLELLMLPWAGLRDYRSALSKRE